MLYTGQELNDLFRAKLPDNLTVTGISIDTRTLKPGDLFIAIKGHITDGHLFVTQAAQAGAAAVLVAKEVVGLGCPQIVVEDTLKAMEQLGQYARQRSRAKIIAVTGSVGKTTTKEILHHMLSAFGKSECSLASFNNHWGVPLSLARLPANADFGIFEIGMNNPGEIAPLVTMVRPHIAIVTTIAPAHIGQMGSLEAIAQEKSSIYSGLSEDGIAIIPTDTPFCVYLQEMAAHYTRKPPLLFGESANADICLQDYQQKDTHGFVTVTTNKTTNTYSLPRPGKHIANNSLIGLAVAQALGIDIGKACQSLETLPEVHRRGQLFVCKIGHKEITIIDDSYNANLTSMIAGLNVLAAMTPLPGGRRIAVIGEMLELGNVAADHHRQVGQALNDLNIDGVYLVGSDIMNHCREVLIKNRFYNQVPSAQDLIPILLDEIQPNDIIFFKGSNGIKLNTVVEAIKKASELPPAQSVR